MSLNRIVLFSGVSLAMCGACSQSDDRTWGHSTVRNEDDRKLSILRPKDQDIERGQTETMTVRLHRDDVAGPVRISLSGLPQGVEAIDAPRETSGDSIEIVLKASEDADLVTNQNVLVSALGPDDMEVTESFNLTVKQ